VRNAQLYEDLKAQVDRDPLTGLLNHRAFYERLEQELARAGRTGDPVAVLVLDLDDFKRINDTRGHLAGDDALRALAGVLLAACRSQDVAARLGGDEFAMILPGAGGDAPATAERLLAEVDAATGLRLSIGGAVAEGPRAHSIRTMSRADSSLLQAKQAGKHTFRLAA
jgi:diguanylate cyclase (GGDEF)-like protein